MTQAAKKRIYVYPAGKGHAWHIAYYYNSDKLTALTACARSISVIATRLTKPGGDQHLCSSCARNAGAER